jgi:maleylacetoacetate isomerase
MIELYNYFRSSASFRVRIALNLKNIDYKNHEIHLVNHGGEQYSEAFEKINAQQLVPVFKNEDKIITQSCAMIEYLDEMHPEPPLLPKDPYQKALVRAFALSIIADMHPLNNLRVLEYLKNDFMISETQKTAWYHHWIKKGFSALEKQLSKNAHFLYCFGDTPTLADICLVPQMYNARRFACDISSFPTLVKMDEHCQKHPAFQKAWPKES